MERNGGGLNTKIKQPVEDFFHEGDVSEIKALIDVTDEFIYSCVEVIAAVYESIEAI